MTTPYEPTQEDIDILLKQIIVDKDRARELLIAAKGDMVAAISAHYNIKHRTHETVDINVNSNHRNDEAVYDTDNTIYMPILDAENDTLDTDAKTHVVITLTPISQNFSKKKSYGTISEVVKRYRADCGVEGQSINIYSVQCELLYKWAITHGGMAMSESQKVTNGWIVEHTAFSQLNKSATLFARASGLIQDSESIVGNVILINNVCFEAKC